MYRPAHSTIRRDILPSQATPRPPSSSNSQPPSPLLSPPQTLHLAPRGFAVPAADPPSRLPGPAARTRGCIPPDGTVPCGLSRGRPPPHSAPPAAAAAFDVSHLRPRLPVPTVAEELPRGGFPSGHLLRPEIGLPTAAEMSGGSGDKVTSSPVRVLCIGARYRVIA